MRERCAVPDCPRGGLLGDISHEAHRPPAKMPPRQYDTSRPAHRPRVYTANPDRPQCPTCGGPHVTLTDRIRRALRR